MRFLQTLPIALLLTLPSFAADPGGDWVMRLKNRVFLSLHVEKSDGACTATVHRPAHFQFYNNGFAKITAEQIEETWQGKVEPNGDILFSGGELPTRLHVTGTDGATLQVLTILNDSTPEPWCLERTTKPEPVSPQWPAGLVYQEQPELPNNAELSAAFERDQEDRTTQPIDWPTVSKTDALHREQTREWLTKGQIRTATDYRNAAFIFQHGSEPGDYLLAHTLALVAVQKGDRASTWIAAATLDRYLQSVGQKQIYGTQYKRPSSGWTQEPSDETLVPESLLKELGVPDREHQRKRLGEMR